MMTDLTEKGQKDYNLDYNYYKNRETAYSKQHTAIKEHEWYDNLKARCGMLAADDKMEVRRQYKEALKAPRTMKEAVSWVERWEIVMAKA